MRRAAITICLPLLLAAAPAAAQDEDPSAKFREALRTTMLQLREAQAKTAEMEATAVQNQMAADKAAKELAALQANTVEERNEAANQAAALREEIGARDAKITGFEAQVAKWQKDHADLTTRLRKAEHAAAQAKARITVLERAVNEQQVKNIEMKLVADEILDRYQGHSLGTTILAREPFIGVNRAKLQTIMQDLETRIRAAGIRPGGVSAPASQPPSNQ